MSRWVFAASRPGDGMVKFDPESLFYLRFLGAPSAFGIGPEWPEVFMLFFLFGF